MDIPSKITGNEFTGGFLFYAIVLMFLRGLNFLSSESNELEKINKMWVRPDRQAELYVAQLKLADYINPGTGTTVCI